jgi:hypothetical protein
MKRNPVAHVGVVMVRSSGIVTELAPVRYRTLTGICRKLMAPGLYRNQEEDGRHLLQRLLGRTEKPPVLEIIVGVLLAARLCDQDIDVKVRAIIAVVDNGTDPGDYPVKVFEEPFTYDLRNADEIAALVASLVPVRGPKNGSDIVLS